jgi:phage tail-like protein
MKDARRNVTVILIDEEGNPCARWEFGDAWPSKCDAQEKRAKGTKVAIETLEISFETMSRVT